MCHLCPPLTFIPLAAVRVEWQAHAHKHRYAAGRGPLGPLTDEELRAFNASFRAAGLEGVSLACISRMGLNDGSVSWAVQKDVDVRKHCGHTLDLYPIMRRWGRDAFHDHIHYNDNANGILLANLLTSLFQQAGSRVSNTLSRCRKSQQLSKGLPTG